MLVVIITLALGHDVMLKVIVYVSSGKNNVILHLLYFVAFVQFGIGNILNTNIFPIMFLSVFLKHWVLLFTQLNN